MPIYEYRCTACGHPFEALVFGDEKAVCPACGAKDLEKRLSAFAVGHGGAAHGGAPACAATGGPCEMDCGDGACPALD